MERKWPRSWWTMVTSVRRPCARWKPIPKASPPARRCMRRWEKPAIIAAWKIWKRRKSLRPRDGSDRARGHAASLEDQGGQSLIRFAQRNGRTGFRDCQGNNGLPAFFDARESQGGFGMDLGHVELQSATAAFCTNGSKKWRIGQQNEPNTCKNEFRAGP